MKKFIFTAVLFVCGIAFADNHGATPAPTPAQAKVEKAGKKVDTATTETTKKVEEVKADGTATATTETTKAKNTAKTAKATTEAAKDAKKEEAKKGM